MTNLGHWLWKKIDGWKSVSGGLLIVLGCAAYRFEFFEPVAPYFLGAGLASFGIGTLHKAEKVHLKKLKLEWLIRTNLFKKVTNPQ